MKLIIMSAIFISSIQAKRIDFWPTPPFPPKVDFAAVSDPVPVQPETQSLSASFQSNMVGPEKCDCRGGAAANPLCCLINGASETSDISASSSFSTCPSDRPQSGDVCNFKDTCYYGKESCCVADKIQTFNSYGCKCEKGRTICFYTDACMMAPATCDNTVNCGGIENCASYATGHEICSCTDYGEICVYNELSNENVTPRKCYECKDGYLLHAHTGECQNKSDIHMRRRLLMTNDYSVTMTIGIIIGALIVSSMIIGVLIVFHCKQKRAVVDLLANEDPIEVV